MTGRYAARRLGTALVTLFFISVLTYALIFIAPGDPAEASLRAQLGEQPTQEQIEIFRVEHGLDEPFHVQYASWVADLLQGDLGESYYHERSVAELIGDRLPTTLALAAGGMGVALLVSVPTGVASAVRPNGYIDHASQLFALVGVAMPNFWLGYLLIFLFAITLGLVPVSGTGGLRSLMLPSITLGTGLAAVQTRLLRSALLDVLDHEFVDASRARGLGERVVVYKHALRNALVPVITVVGLQLGMAINGAVIVEVVFQRPGLGALLVEAVFDRDYPVVQGVTLLAGATFIVVNVATDVVYRRLDPRISIGGAGV
ncbi:ABC-type transport system permease protein (probable substrate dipeptide/oligopeptide) [Natronomonas pharaonis DSM 2160]|uniref:ABC-type transport system permease protein (Probable substrate dipeptide/oligopeptide) n=1 Tax=Natronomonas pharaonis (strain ATCC 35678 / DSM 2160 / CIP 103997 / JCM 8858 / NBRC 14720 / NCIMB 2260 / Gabara) TaxID=348780 RepID=A0A1U7EXH9_NATPD|nr:nickel ABC transporter permease [Natronomonas pharaonis]CAI49881.1 ABC-type transport system permease protein (probable substrate dipeptide/oligopeptide) [Natronomonas pharaonis DSM 2160]